MIYISLQANLRILELHHSTFPYIIATSRSKVQLDRGPTTQLSQYHSSTLGILSQNQRNPYSTKRAKHCK